MDSDLNTHPLLSPTVKSILDETVSKTLGRAWHNNQFQDLSDLASHPSGILSDDSQAVFAKYSLEPGAVQRFELERAGLVTLASQAGVRVPIIIGVVPAGEGALLIMEALTAIPRGPSQWHEIGLTLAALHRVKSDQFGFHQDNYFGPLLQDNTPTRDWPTFYGERRLHPYLRMAVDAGHLPRKLTIQVESIIQRLPELCGPQVTPSLLHGDAQGNNFVSTAQGTYLVDPAVHFGHPEMDLAYLDYFQPVPPLVLEAYREVLPIDPGFPSRRKLWHLATDLALVALEGEAYLGQLQAGLEKYT